MSFIFFNSSLCHTNTCMRGKPKDYNRMNLHSTNLKCFPCNSSISHFFYPLRHHLNLPNVYATEFWSVWPCSNWSCNWKSTTWATKLSFSHTKSYQIICFLFRCIWKVIQVVDPSWKLRSACSDLIMYTDNLRRNLITIRGDFI